MKVHLKSTTKIVTLNVNGFDVPARIWEGHTENGVACHAYITRIAVANTDNSAEFDRDLSECSPPSEKVQAIPLRMIL